MKENIKNMSDPTVTGEFKEIKMRKRSTTEVKSLLKYANDELKRQDEFATKEFKMGICNMIEFILFETGNYLRLGENLKHVSLDRRWVGFVMILDAIHLEGGTLLSKRRRR